MHFDVLSRCPQSPVLAFLRWPLPPQGRSNLTTILTTTMTTVTLPDTSAYTTVGLAPCLFAPPARAYGLEGYGFESLWGITFGGSPSHDLSRTRAPDAHSFAVGARDSIYGAGAQT
jgi:hypothetical protein